MGVRCKLYIHRELEDYTMRGEFFREDFLLWECLRETVQNWQTLCHRRAFVSELLTSERALFSVYLHIIKTDHFWRRLHLGRRTLSTG